MENRPELCGGVSTEARGYSRMGSKKALKQGRIAEEQVKTIGKCRN
jgi:hypothetical protein